MPHPPKWLVQWVGVGVIVAAGVAVVFVAQREMPPQPSAEVGLNAPQDAASSTAALAAEARYREEVLAAIVNWDDAQDPPVYGVLQQRLMDITVPSSFRQPHLDLVIAATALKEAQRSGNANARASAVLAFTRALERFSFTSPDGNN